MKLDTIGKNIRKIRVAKKMRQEDLAEKSGLSVTYIGMVERAEKTPSLESLISILNSLGASADMVLCDVLTSGYEVKHSMLNDKLEQLSPDDRAKIYDVIEMTMLNKKNFLLIPDICDFFVSFGIKKVMFANYICQGKNKDRNSILDKNEVNCALNSIHSMRQKYESSDFYVSRTGAFGFDSMHGCNLCCDAGTEGFVILPNRKVCPCVFLCENNFFIGEYAKGCDFLSCSTFAHDFYSCFALENLNYCTDK